MAEETHVVYERLKKRLRELKETSPLVISSNLNKEAYEQAARFGDVGFLKAEAASFYESCQLIRKTWEREVSLSIRTHDASNPFPYEFSERIHFEWPAKLTEGFIEDILGCVEVIKSSRQAEVIAKNLLGEVMAFEEAYGQRNWMLKLLGGLNTAV